MHLPSYLASGIGARAFCISQNGKTTLGFSVVSQEFPCAQQANILMQEVPVAVRLEQNLPGLYCSDFINLTFMLDC